MVAVFAVLMAMSEGFAAALRSTGRDGQRDHRAARVGLRADLGACRWTQRNQIIVDDRIARGSDGQPLASWEWVIVISLPKRGRQPTNVTLRAVPPTAFEVRRRHRSSSRAGTSRRASTR